MYPRYDPAVPLRQETTFALAATAQHAEFHRKELHGSPFHNSSSVPDEYVHPHWDVPWQLQKQVSNRISMHRSGMDPAWMRLSSQPVLRSFRDAGPSALSTGSPASGDAHT